MHWPLTFAGNLHLHSNPTKQIHWHFLEDRQIIRALTVRLLKGLLIALCLIVGMAALIILSFILGLN